MSKSQEDHNTQNIPTHIGFIVDGNRRWARERNLPTLEGHRRGFSKMEKIAEAIFDKGVKYASFYVFSTENWDRSKEEVSYLMDLLRNNITRLSKKLQKKGIKLVVLGRREPAPQDVLDSLSTAEELTKNGKNGTVCICFNYGGKWEIADAINKLISDRLDQDFARANKNAHASINNSSAKTTPATSSDNITTITPKIVEQYLYHPEIPPCDLIVRTSGEERISGFMLWRAAYSEFLFLKKYFPDMEVADLDEIIHEFSTRKRRFGK
ncbi:di-trans,poly-cis-decaprenylcistransferase [Candidatus Saccharibacteria bacterium]|nr:di-trans,poly-cis-decaprenylcistransferase [Candidatus Saccharibacteria bacterium]